MAQLIVFASTHETMQAEALLAEAGVSGALVLKPKGLVGNCGLALQVGEGDSAPLLSLLAARQILPAAVYSRFDADRWEIVA